MRVSRLNEEKLDRVRIAESKVRIAEKRFKEALIELAKSGMKFWASDDLGCYKIYFALQDALDRSLQEFPQLYVKFVETKPHLEAPAGADERLKKQYTICNVLFGYKEDYEKLSDEIKAHLESLRKVAENVLKGGIGKPLY